MKFKYIINFALLLSSLSLTSCSKADSTLPENKNAHLQDSNISANISLKQKIKFDCLNENTGFKENQATMNQDEIVQKFALASQKCCATPEEVYTFASYVELNKY